MEQPNNYETPRGGGLPEKWVPGLVLIAVGAIFFLDNLHIFRIHDLLSYWPVILVAAGLFQIIDCGTTMGKIGGGILAAVGGVFLARNLGYLPIGWGEMWPLILVAVGVLMLANRITGESWKWPHGNWTQSGGGGHLHESAVFGGGKRIITDNNFTGGKVDAVFSGYEIDLRGAHIASNSAVLDVNAVFGGVEVKIPLNWNAVVKGAGVFGGYVDNTRHPNPAEVPNIKQVVFKGGAVFGGVEIKN